MDPHDQRERARIEAQDPERAAVTALQRAERAMPGSLTDAARARIADWERSQLAGKAAASVATPSEVAGG